MKLIDFSNDLDTELSWRKYELYILKSSIPESANKKQQAFLRMAIPILYAHFEGFIKVSAYYYLKYVTSRKLKYSELLEQFIIIGLKSKLNLKEANSIEKQTKIIKLILENFDNQLKLPTKNIINTKSNLNFKVFSEILFLIGLDKKIFKNYESVINDLITHRNYIAHGENKTVDKDTFEKFYSEIINLMSCFKTVLEDHAIQEKYKKRPNNIVYKQWRIKC